MTLLQPIARFGCGCDTPEGGKTLISLDVALDLVARTVPEILEAEEVPLSGARGRSLARPVLARAMAPAFDHAAMDGYALCTADLSGKGPWSLEVADRIAAGTGTEKRLSGHQAARIFTGAPVPPGADAVIAQEEVFRDAGMIVLRQRPPVGLNIRRAGADMRKGDRILDRGAQLGPGEIAACAAAGVASLSVKKRPRVALLVTGDEVRTTGARREEAQIWDINGPMIDAALTAEGVDLVQVDAAGDDRSSLERTLRQMAREADLVITTGGISVGEEDHVKPAMQALGADIRFSGVAIKPGKPVSFGRIGTAIWLGLPGNPLAAFVTWQIFGTAILRAFRGAEEVGSGRRHVVLGSPIHRKTGRCELRPASVIGFDASGREVVSFAEKVNSGHVAALPRADGLILLPHDSEALPQGALVEFQPFPIQ